MERGKKMKQKFIMMVVLMLVLTAGCSQAEKPKQIGSNPTRETEETATTETKPSTTSSETKPVTPVALEPTPGEFKAACGSVPYDELARFPDRNVAKQLVMSGEIIQVTEDESGSIYRLKLNDDYDQIVMIFYQGSFDQGQILDGDRVTFWGKYGGTISYDSTMGGNITIPGMLALYYGINV